MDSVAKFAKQAAFFQDWLLSGTDQESDSARECLIRLLELYLAGIQLPPEWSDELEGRADVESISNEEWLSAVEATRRLPLDFYKQVFDPTEITSQGPVMGSLSDDLADIYRDVVTGLRAYEHGELAEAVWEWSFGLHIPWGAHATSAILALYWWLCNNSPNHLSDGGTG